MNRHPCTGRWRLNHGTTTHHKSLLTNPSGQTKPSYSDPKAFRAARRLELTHTQIMEIYIPTPLWSDLKPGELWLLEGDDPDVTIWNVISSRDVLHSWPSHSLGLKRDAFQNTYSQQPSDKHNQAYIMGFPGSSDSNESTCNAGDLGSIPVLGRFSRGQHGHPLQYSCLENPHGEEPSGLQSMELQRTGHNWAHTCAHTHTPTLQTVLRSLWSKP